MKIAEIKADGTTYWFERQNGWGKYLSANFSRGRIKRVGEQRFTRIGSTWSSNYREDPQGKYILAQRVPIEGDGYQGGDQLYVLGAQVRDEFEAVKARYEQAQRDQRAAAISHQHQIDAANERADALRARLADTGLDKLIQVRVLGTETYPYVLPRIDFTFKGSSAEADLASLLTYVEGLAARG